MVLASCKNGTQDLDPESEDVQKQDQSYLIEQVYKTHVGDTLDLPLSGIKGTGITTLTSSEPSVATIDQNGHITILAAGETTITVSNPGDDSYGSVEVTGSVVAYPAEFITTWVVPSGNLTVTIPTWEYSGTYNHYAYDYNVDWGDGSITSNATGDASHTYVSAGTYTIKVGGTFSGVNFYQNNILNGDSRIVNIDNWGSVSWKSLSQAFENCQNLSSTAKDSPDLSEVTDASRVFAYCYNFNGYIGNWDTSHITDMSNMLYYCYNFNKDIGDWDTSKVTDMGSMFCDANVFNQNIGSWNTSSVTNMYEMFKYAYAFNQNISSWDTSRVTDMTSMFEEATSFNCNLRTWNVSSVVSYSDFSTSWGGTAGNIPNFP